MEIDDDEAAARLLLMMHLLLKPSTKQSVSEEIEREDRVFVRVPRKKRSLRIPISSSSSSSSSSSFIATTKYSSKEDLRARIHGPLMESLTNPTRNSKQRPPPLSPPMDTHKAKREPDCRLAAGASSSSSIVEYVSKEDLQAHIHGPLMESPTRKSKKRPPLFLPKKAKREPDGRFTAGASSSGTTTPEWLLRLMASKNGAEPKKIIEKELTATDVSSGHGRLSMPFSQIVDFEFLNPEEERIIQEKVKKLREKGVDAKLVVVVGSDPKEYEVNLRRWNMEKKKKTPGIFTSVYNLVTGWNQVVKDYGLKKNDKIRLWSFHANEEEEEKLYFAFVPPPPPLSASAAVIPENPNPTR